MKPLTVAELIELLSKIDNKENVTVWTSKDSPVTGLLGIDDNSALILEN